MNYLFSSLVTAEGLAEIYDPTFGAFTRTGDMVVTGRTGHTATLLPNGLVLITGGGFYFIPGDYYVPLRSTELFDPATGTFSFAGDMNLKRMNHTAVLLQNGQVLIASGINDGYFGYATPTAELYDPNSGTFVRTGDMALARFITLRHFCSMERYSRQEGSAASVQRPCHPPKYTILIPEDLGNRRQ